MKILAPSSKLLENLFPEAQYAEIPMDSAVESFQWDDITCANPVCFEFHGTQFPKIFDFNGYGILEEYSGTSQFDRLRNWRGPAVFALALSGRGFHGQNARKWHTEAGNLHLSMAVPVHLPISCAPAIQFLPGFVISQGINSFKTDDAFVAEVKPPNDVIIKMNTGSKAGIPHKIAGILTEMRVSGQYITQVRYGIGMNIMHAPNITDSEHFPAISLKKLTSNLDMFQKTSIYNALRGSMSTCFNLLFNYLKDENFMTFDMNLVMEDLAKP